MSDWAGGPFFVIEDFWFTNQFKQKNMYCKPFVVVEDFLGNEPLLSTETISSAFTFPPNCLRCAEEHRCRQDIEPSDVTGGSGLGLWR